MKADNLEPAVTAEPWSFAQRLREIDMFFQGTDRVHQTMRRVAEKLQSANIPYAIVGGMAVNAHRYERTTKDVDILLTAEGLKAFRQQFIGTEFDAVAGRPRRFRDRANGTTFDVLVTGYFPGSGKPGPISYPDPAAVSVTISGLSVVDLPTLVALKLAARRYQDFADVVNLIRANQLEESFSDRLPQSVRGDFVECLEEMRREDEYEARLDQAVQEGIPPAESPGNEGDS
jgi:hypothetical protein